VGGRAVVACEEARRRREEGRVGHNGLPGFY
jgi:hypothetical protein